MIFEPAAVSDEDFPQWWEQVSRWEEPRDYYTTCLLYTSDAADE